MKNMMKWSLALACLALSGCNHDESKNSDAQKNEQQMEKNQNQVAKKQESGAQASQQAMAKKISYGYSSENQQSSAAPKAMKKVAAVDNAAGQSSLSVMSASHSSGLRTQAAKSIKISEDANNASTQDEDLKKQKDSKNNSVMESQKEAIEEAHDDDNEAM